MRRAQSVRLHSRNSLSSAAGNPGSSQLALHTDDLGVLREGDESDADVLRKQLLEKDRECDRVSFVCFSLLFYCELIADCSSKQTSLSFNPN